MSSWKMYKEDNDKEQMSVTERALLVSAAMADTCMTMNQLREEMLNNDATLIGYEDKMWDLVVCPKCGWHGFAFQTFLQGMDNDPNGPNENGGQIVYYDGCGAAGCKEPVLTVLEFRNGIYRQPTKGRD